MAGDVMGVKACHAGSIYRGFERYQEVSGEGEGGQDTTPSNIKKPFGCVTPSASECIVLECTVTVPVAADPTVRITRYLEASEIYVFPG